MDDSKVCGDLICISTNKSLGVIVDEKTIQDVDFPDQESKEEKLDDFFHLIEDLSLWRMVGRNPPYYKLKKYEKEQKSLSLFLLKRNFVEGKEKDGLDCWFLQFMFWVVMEENITKAIEEEDLNYFDSRKSAILIMKKLKQLAMSDDIFCENIECIEVSLKQRQEYFNFADHWDLKYKNHADDEKREVQEMLYSATQVFERKDGFNYMINQLHVGCITNG